MTAPRVIAVVLNWCDEEVSRACLRSLDESDYHPLSVLLVDNASPDGSGERLQNEFPHIDFLQTGSNLGYSGGNNRGIEWALKRGADFILVLNNDTVIEAEAIAKLVEAAEEGGASSENTAEPDRFHLDSNGPDPRPIGGVSPKILIFDEPDRIWFGGGHFSALRGLGLHWREGERDDPQETQLREITFMTGCCCLFSAGALRELNGFDETFFAYVEDAELSVRMAEAGYRMLFQPVARVLHHTPPLGTLPTPFQIRQRDRNRRRVMCKHYSLRQRIPFLAWFFITRAVLFFRYVLSGDEDRAEAILEGMRSEEP